MSSNEWLEEMKNRQQERDALLKKRKNGTSDDDTPENPRFLYLQREGKSRKTMNMNNDEGEDATFFGP